MKRVIELYICSKTAYAYVDLFHSIQHRTLGLQPAIKSNSLPEHKEAPPTGPPATHVHAQMG